MAICAQMKKGEIYVCSDCGVELQVVSECADQGTCAADRCEVTCCDGAMVLKGHMPPDANWADEAGG